MINDEDDEQEVEETIQEPIIEDEPKVVFEKEEKVKKSTSSSKSPNPLTFVPNTLPHPQHFKKKEIDSQFAKFVELFKKLHINIPFVEALEQMANYAKFMKDVLSKKKKLGQYEMISMTEECSAVLQKKLPQKLKDLGSSTIPCTISSLNVIRAFCYLGAFINLMPLSVYRKLDIGHVQPTTIIMQLADRSLA